MKTHRWNIENQGKLQKGKEQFYKRLKGKKFQTKSFNKILVFRHKIM